MQQSLNKQVYLYTWTRSAQIKKVAAFLFLGVFLFLYLFRPFIVNEDELKYPFFLICLFHALSPALIVLIYFTVLNRLYHKKTNKSNPSVFQMISLFVPLFFIIGTASFLMRDLIYTNPDNWSLRYFWEEIRNSYLAGVLFMSYSVFARFYFQSRKNLSHDSAHKDVTAVNDRTAVTDDDTVTGHKIAGVNNENAKTEITGVINEIIETVGQEPKSEDKQRSLTNPAEIFIKAHVKIDDFSFNPSHFLFARAEGNYVELMMRTDRGIKQELKRISLKQLELQLSQYTGFIRSHRGYLININQVTDISGNSQGYLVSFEGIEDKIPVSRANLEIFDQHYQSLKNNR